MRLGRVVVAVATMWFSTTTAFAQFIVIRTGQNVDGVLSTQLVDGKLTFGLPSGEKISIPIEYVDTRLTREVSGRPTSPAPAAPAVGSASTGSASDIINQHCEAEWKTNFQMQAFCRKTQQEALASILGRQMNSPNEKTIRQQCLTEWAGNFQMVNFCEEQQLKALKSLGRE